jgi:hypothetical protein
MALPRTPIARQPVVVAGHAQVAAATDRGAAMIYYARSYGRRDWRDWIGPYAAYALFGAVLIAIGVVPIFV